MSIFDNLRELKKRKANKGVKVDKNVEEAKVVEVVGAVEGLEEKTNDELRKMLQERDLATYGAKKELIERLKAGE